jgi:hypothetical protein
MPMGRELPRCFHQYFCGSGTADILDILSELYDLVLPLISRSGRFEQRSLDTLAESYVDLKLLPAKPEMARTYTEQFLPK